MNNEALKVWQQFMNSMQQGNNEWQDLLADDVTFTGPLQQASDKEGFINLVSDFFKMVSGIDIHHHAAGDEIVATEGTITIKRPKAGSSHSISESSTKYLTEKFER